MDFLSCGSHSDGNITLLKVPKLWSQGANWPSFACYYDWFHILTKVDEIHNHLMSHVSQFPHKIGNAAFSWPVIKNPLATKILIISLWSFGASTIFISCREESACCEKSQCRQTLDITWTDRSRLKLWRCHLYTTPEKESTCAKSSVFTIHNFCCKRISY
jgi:hypothetical protein